MWLSICCYNYLHCAQICPGTTQHLSSWEHRQQISKAHGVNRQTAWTGETEVQSLFRRRHKAWDWRWRSPCLRGCRGSHASCLTRPGKRKRGSWSIQLLRQWNRFRKRKKMKEQSLKTLKQSFDWGLIEARNFYDWRNKHKMRISATFLVLRYDDTKDARIPTSLRKRGRWHPGVIITIRMPSQESWEPEVCKLPFLQLNISFHESRMSQLFVLFALALLQIGKCQSFLDKQKLLIVELMNELKNIFNSHEDTMSHNPHCQTWDEQ